MKFFIVTVGLLMTSMFAQARGLCAPTVELEPISLVCESAQVVIYLRVSPEIPACEADYQSWWTAQIELQKPNGQITKVSILDESFLYNPISREFNSPKYGISLSGCTENLEITFHYGTDKNFVN